MATALFRGPADAVALESAGDRVRMIVSDLIPAPFGFVGTVTDATTFHALQADSLDMVSLAVTIENCFAVRIDDDEAAAINTIGDAVALVERKIGGARITPETEGESRHG